MLSTSEIIKKVRHIEIKTRGLVNQVFSGEYHSVFKGRGMAFSEVREYQAGDDVRNIDWNVTARFDHPFVKVFEEERELTVMLCVDMSGSQKFGTSYGTKMQIAAEISAILAFSALKNNDKVGLILFSDQIELFIPPKKSKTHTLRIIRELLSFEPKGTKTNLKQALEFLSNTVNRRSIVFLISDFKDTGYGQVLKILGRKHDLIGVVLKDDKEINLPKVGLIDFIDPESGEIVTVDTSSKAFRQSFNSINEKQEEEQKSLFLTARLDSIYIDTKESYIKPLVNFFKTREKR